eukprot:596641-Pleurochrysis_carterae.AAC.1
MLRLAISKPGLAGFLFMLGGGRHRNLESLTSHELACFFRSFLTTSPPEVPSKPTLLSTARRRLTCQSWICPHTFHDIGKFYRGKEVKPRAFGRKQKAYVDPMFDGQPGVNHEEEIELRRVEAGLGPHASPPPGDYSAPGIHQPDGGTRVKDSQSYNQHYVGGDEADHLVPPKQPVKPPRTAMKKAIVKRAKQSAGLQKAVHVCKANRGDRDREFREYIDQHPDACNHVKIRCVQRSALVAPDTLPIQL